MKKILIISMMLFTAIFSNLLASGLEYGVNVGIGASAIFKTKIPSNVEVLDNFKKGYSAMTPEMSALVQVGYFLDIDKKQTFSFLSDLGFLYENGYSYKVQSQIIKNEIDNSTTINKYYYGPFGMPSFSGGLLFRYTVYDISVALGSGAIVAQQELGYAKFIFEYNLAALKSANTVLGAYVRYDFAPNYGYNNVTFGLNVGLRFGGRPQLIEERRLHREASRLTNTGPRD